MANFYEHVDWETARRLESLSRLSLELRTAREDVLRHYGVAHEDALVARLGAGECDEHPVWEHVLALRILADTREGVRRMIAAGGRADAAPDPLHLQLQQWATAALAAQLAAPPRLTQDALLLDLRNGLTLTVHYAAPDAYSLRWRATAGDGDAAGIDTAPRPGTPAGSHLHLADGRVMADTVTRVGAPPADNLRAVVDALGANPRCGQVG